MFELKFKIKSSEGGNSLSFSSPKPPPPPFLTKMRSFVSFAAIVGLGLSMFRPADSYVHSYVNGLGCGLKGHSCPTSTRQKVAFSAPSAPRSPTALRYKDDDSVPRTPASIKEDVATLAAPEASGVISIKFLRNILLNQGKTRALAGALEGGAATAALTIAPTPPPPPP